MLKAMLFIDGNWLYKCTPGLGRVSNRPGLKIDYGELPTVLMQELSRRVGSEVDLVRKFLFASYPEHYDELDTPAARRTVDFLLMLVERQYYEVVSFPIDYRGRRLRAADRDPDDDFDPHEKCIDVALASTMLYYAALPHSYDIALAVLGDKDLKPALKNARLLGKRVAIASIQANCAKEYRDPGTSHALKDFDIIWLDHLVDRIAYDYDPVPLEPKPLAVPLGEELSDALGILQDQENAGRSQMPELLVGRVKNIVSDRGFAFLQTRDGRDYFFHMSFLEDGIEFDKLRTGDEFAFEVEREPAAGKAGMAKNIRRFASSVESSRPE
jgi:cold shock CspA family protein